MATVMIIDDNERALVAAVRQALEAARVPRDALLAQECMNDRCVLEPVGVDPFSFAGGGESGRPFQTRSSSGASIVTPVECETDGPDSGANATASARAGRALASPVLGSFRLQGEYWAIAFDGQTLHLKDTKGLRYVAYLLKNPGQRLRALDVVGAVHQGAAPGSNGGWVFGDSCDPIVDRQTLSAWRARLHELQEEIEEAITCNDLGRIDKLRHESEWLTQQIKAACGLNGRLRGMPSPSERARQRLTKGVWGAVKRIGRFHDALASHLARCIKTGRLCGYEPDADRPVVWVL